MIDHGAEQTDAYKAFEAMGCKIILAANLDDGLELSRTHGAFDFLIIGSVSTGIDPAVVNTFRSNNNLWVISIPNNEPLFAETWADYTKPGLSTIESWVATISYFLSEPNTILQVVSP